MILENVMKQSDKFLFTTHQELPHQTISSDNFANEPNTEEDLPDPIDYLKYIMKQRGLSYIDLEGDIGSFSNITSILNRHKPLSLQMIRNLHYHFNIPAKILIQPYDCR